MNRHGIIDSVTKRVVNLIEYDAAATWSPQPGTTLVLSALCQNARIGDTWNGAAFVSPEPVPYVVPPDVRRCRDYVVSTTPSDVADQLDQYLAAASPTLAQTVAALKETISTLRADIRVLKRQIDQR